MALLDDLRWRYATKKMNGQKVPRLVKLKKVRTPKEEFITELGLPKSANKKMKYAASYKVEDREGS